MRFFRLLTALGVVGWWAVVGAAGQVPAPAGPNCGLTISGQVTDHESRQGLPGATVVVRRLPLPGEPASAVVAVAAVTQTDDFGNYHLHDLCAGAYQVQTSFVGYATGTDDLRLLRPAVLNPKLHPDAVQLGTATVRARASAAPTPQAATSLRGAALQATRGQSLGEALTKIAGVSAIQTGPSIYKPMIHGLHSNRITLLNNGVRQEGQQWGQEHGPEVDPFLATDLTVVKGAAAVRYGADAIGGVILVQPAPLRDSVGVGGRADLVAMTNNGLGAASATLDGNLRRLPGLSGRVQGTVKRAGTTRTPDYTLKNSAFAEYDYSAAVGWRGAGGTWGTEAFFSQYNTRLGILSAAHVGNLADLERAFAAARPLETGPFSYAIGRPYQQVRHDLAKLSAWWHPVALGRFTLTVARQTDLRDEYDKYRPRNNNLAALNQPELSYQNRTTTADLVLDHRPWLGALTGTVGLSATYQDNTFRGRYFLPYYTNQVAGAFLIERWSRGRWLLEAGARLDFRTLVVKRALGTTASYRVEKTRFPLATPAGSLGVVYDPGPHLTLRLSGAISRRAPAPNERYSQGVHNGLYEEGFDLTRAPGEAPLQPETARALSLTSTWHTNPRFNGELTAYLTQLAGYIYAAPVLPPVLTVRGPFPSFRYQQTDARLWGFDAAGTWAPARAWLLAGKVAVVRTRDTRRREWLIFSPADRAELSVRREFGPAAPVAVARFGGFYVQAGTQAVARQTRTPPVYTTVDYKATPGAYWLLGAQAGATWRAGRLPLEVALSGANLLNRRYRDYLNRFRYFADEMGRNLTLRLSTRF